MITDSDVIFQLKQKNLSSCPDLSKLGPLEQGLWVLQIAKDKLQIKGLSSTAISKVLAEVFEVEASKIAITRAFARARGKIKLHKDDGKATFYEIMRFGRESLKTQVVSFNDVQFFSGKECWTNVNVTLLELIEQLTGNLNIIDPYYGFGTLNVLQKFGKKRKINFLTKQLGGKEGKDLNNFKVDFTRFLSEFKNIEFKQLDEKDEVHDRYIISDDALLIVGHGFKDIGTKESFVIYLPTEKVQGFLPILKKGFEVKWSKAKTITL